MLKHILQFILILVSSLLIYLSNNYFIITSLFFLILVFTINKNPFSLLSIIPLFAINQTVFFIYLLFYLLLYITEKKMYKKKYKIPSLIFISFSTTLITYIIVEYDYRILIISLLLSIVLILLDNSFIKHKNSITNEMIMLILFSLNTTPINFILYIFLFSCFIIISNINHKTKYYIFTSFLISISAFLSTKEYLYLTIQLIAYLCYLFNNIFAKKPVENQLEYVIDDINNNVTNFCSFLNHFNKVSFNSDYEKKLSEAIKILISNFCMNCINKGECFGNKKVKTYLYMKELLTNKKQINSSTNKSELFNCKYYFNMSEKALHLQKQYNLIETLNIDDLKISTICLSIQNYFISIFDKINPQTIKLINFKKNLIDSNIPFNDFKYQIIEHDNYQFKIYSKKTKDLISIYEFSEKYFSKYNSTITMCEGYINIHPRRKYKVNYDSATLSLNNHQISGDNILTRTINEVNFVCALSDGMGSGFDAYQLSEETLSMVDKILNCNISFDSSLQIINNFSKARDIADSFATLDLVDIDLKNGILRLYKLGSSTTYISRGDKIIPIYNNNLPFGINELITKEEFNVCDGDLIILVSDGVNDYIEESVLINYIEMLRNETAHKIVFEILQKIYHDNSGTIKDDMSCIAIKVKLFENN